MVGVSFQPLLAGRTQAFPVVAASSSIPQPPGPSGGSSPNASSHTLDLPTGITAGDLLIAGMACDGASTIGWPAGWTAFASSEATDPSTELAYRFADGSEGSSISITTSTTEEPTAFCYRITGAHPSAAPEATIGSVVNTTSPNPPSLSPSWGSAKTLWIAFVAVDDQGGEVTGFPSNYPDNRLANHSESGANSSCIGVATRELEAASDDPNTFTLATTRSSLPITIAVRPA
jgi:hypothetical protein